ncbi:MAG: PAS domain S-box protein [Bryobacteraceae bacterium]
MTPQTTSAIPHGLDVVTLVNAGGEVLCTSPSIANAFGYYSDELVGQSAFDVIHPGDHRDARRAIRGALTGPFTPHHLKMRVRKKLGRWCWVQSTISNFLDEPRVGAIVVSLREISPARGPKDSERQSADESELAIAQPGAALGLVLCKRIIEALGGRLWLDSKPGEKPVFCFALGDMDHQNAVVSLLGSEGTATPVYLRRTNGPQLAASR